MRILFADDHIEIRRVLKSLLEARAGWVVCGEAVNGIEAVEKASELKPDIIVMDLSMPEMDGLEASRMISATAPQTPILLHTNYSLSPDAILEAKKSGVWEVLTKGIPDQLLKGVEELHLRACARQGDQVVEEKDSGLMSLEDLDTELA